MSASPLVAEAMGCAGFDWGVLDMEHSPLDLLGLAQLLQAVGTTSMAAGGARALERHRAHQARDGRGRVHQLLVPFVQNAEEAARAVAATRYPPEGVRGMAGMSRASRFGTTPNYMQTANQGL